MKRIDVLCQLPVRQRYTLEWYNIFKEDQIFRLNRNVPIDSRVKREKSYNYFTNLENSVFCETSQINELFKRKEITDLLILDLDFPGIVVSIIPALKLKHPNMKVYGIYHAGSWCHNDIFKEDTGKYFQELSSFFLCQAVFVATEYHKDKICNFFKGVGVTKEYFYDSIEVLHGLPFYPYKLLKYQKSFSQKTGDILIVGRKEQSEGITLFPESSFNIDIHSGLINREKYLEKLSKYKVAIFPKSEETFGYGPLEAAAVGTIPLVPDAFSYKEVINEPFRYTTYSDLTHKVDDAIKYRFQGYFSIVKNMLTGDMVTFIKNYIIKRREK